MIRIINNINIFYMICFINIVIVGNMLLTQESVRAVEVCIIFSCLVVFLFSQGTTGDLILNILPISPVKSSLGRLRRKAFQVFVLHAVLWAVLVYLLRIDPGNKLFRGDSGFLLTCILSWVVFFISGIFSRNRYYCLGYKLSALMATLPLLWWYDAMTSVYLQILMSCYLFLLFLYLIWVFTKVDRLFITGMKLSKKKSVNHRRSKRRWKQNMTSPTIPNLADAPMSLQTISQPAKPSTPGPTASNSMGFSERQPTSFRPVYQLLKGEIDQLHVPLTVAAIFFILIASLIPSDPYHMTPKNLFFLNLAMFFGSAPLISSASRYRSEHQDSLVLPIARKHIVQAWLIFLLSYVAVLMFVGYIGQIIINHDLWPWSFLFLAPTLILQLFAVGTLKEPGLQKGNPEHVAFVCVFLLINSLNLASWAINRFWGKDLFSGAFETSLPPALLIFYFLLTILLLVWRTRVYIKGPI